MSGDLDALLCAIVDAHAALRPQVLVTPLSYSHALSARLGCSVSLKGEHLQPTGSFKFRGASNRIRSLSANERRRGVITASSGNHGQAVATAGARAGVDVTVYVAHTAAPSKMEAIRSCGATLRVIEGETVAAELAARRDAGLQGKTYISPYNDPIVVAGQGTIGAELAEQAPDLDAIFVAVGGGGLIGGIGTALKRLAPKTRVIGVWPENSAALLRSLEAGVIVETLDLPTLSDGTVGAVEPGSITFPICQAVIEQRVSVTEGEIAAAMRLVAETDHWIVEGAAGVALAGLVKTRAAWVGRKVGVVICGRNISLDTYLAAITQRAH